MLDGYGIHTLVWGSVDERLGDFLVASPADATGRSLELHVRQGGAAADLTDAEVYFLWKHKMTGERGCEPMIAVNAAQGIFQVYYPAAMCEEEGTVGAQCMVSWDDKSISTCAFTIRVEPVLVGGTKHEDGFTLFVGTIKRYEGAIEITTAAADAANEAAEAAEDAADSATAVAAAIQQRADDGDFDGADGSSPTATVTQTSEGATITITDKNGTTTANVSKGAKGNKGDTGETGPQGATGPAGADGMPCTHSWNGTVLSVTSASGTSSADLVGPQGPTGATGPAGADGTVFTPATPLVLSDGTLSLDLAAYSLHQALTSVYDFTDQKILPAKGTATSKTFPKTHKAANASTGDLLFNTLRDRIASISMAGGSGMTANLGFKTFMDFSLLQGIVVTTSAGVDEGSYDYACVGRKGHTIAEGALVLNTTIGNLTRVASTTSPLAAS